MTELGLNENHQLLLMTYIKFAKQQRSQNLKAVYRTFQDVIETRLLEETYTADEVRELMVGLCTVVCADVETELMSHSHSTVLMLRQLLAQAEKWHLKLTVDMSQLHDREQLSHVAALEEGGFGSSVPASTHPAGGRLAPLSADSDKERGGTLLLMAEIKRLENHCGTLGEQLEEAKLLAHVRQQQIIRLNDELDSVREKLGVVSVSSEPPKMTKESAASDDRVNELEEQVSKLSLNLSVAASAKSDIECQLFEAQEELKVMRARLTLAEKELECKFSDTTAYTNMKRILSNKNEQLRELRSRLCAADSENKAVNDAVADASEEDD